MIVTDATENIGKEPQDQ